MHSSSHYVSGVMPGAPPVRSPDAQPGDCRPALKQLLDHYHSSAEYKVEHIASAPASEPLQFSCSLTVPKLVRPGTGEELLEACTFTALGRGKAEAEQKCAQQALAHIAEAAPHIGAKEA